MHYLLRKQVVLPVIIFLSCIATCMRRKRSFVVTTTILLIILALTLGYNYSFAHIQNRRCFCRTTVSESAEPGSSGGIAMGLMATARLSDHFQVRANPQLIIGGSKYIAYTLSPKQNPVKRFSKPDAPGYAGKFSDTGKIQFRQDR
jgi:hypothetical protein